jgi:hypothetical protein
MKLLSVICVLQLFASSDCWSLQSKVWGPDFFNFFNFVTADDPTSGYVDYVDQATAESSGYITTYDNNDTYIGCDHTNIASGRGRQSVRLESKTTYNYGIFMLYLSHMPTGCGTWPSWWTYGPDWPNNGEIDVIECVDNIYKDQSTLHTGPNCNMDGQPDNYTGSLIQPDCEGDLGCGIINENAQSSGAPFNTADGGLYAMRYVSYGVSMWFWNEGSIPENALSDDPNPQTWGEPYANFPFSATCPESNIVDQTITFDLTFCGDWDGAVFSTDCPGMGSCQSFVQNNPAAFDEAYWLIHWMKVFG